MRHVIIGASAGGLAAAESILEVEPGADVTLISEEPREPYCRPLISYWIARATAETLFPLPTPVLSRVRLRTGTRIVRAAPAQKRLCTASGEEIPYDKLCLATGASSKLIGIEGEDLPNVFGFRTLEDAEAIESELERGAGRALVLGGGLVGVKAAQALAARGLDTKLCITSQHPLSQVVDEDAGELVARALQEEGVEVRVGYRPAVIDAAGGRATGVRFDPPGVVEACDLVVRGKGVDPRTELARGFDFDVDFGIPTDAELRTPLPDVWAVGDAALTFDVAHRRQRVNAIWPMAVEQGTVAGRNMAGARHTYAGSLAMNSVRVGALHVVSAGVTRPPAGAYEVRTRGDGRRSLYRKMVLQDGVLVGAIFAGSADQAGLAVSAIRQGVRLDELPYDPLDERIHWGRYAFAAGASVG